MSDNLTIIHKNLNSLIGSKQEALPSDFNQTRFIQNCMTVLQDTKEIEKMESVSVARTLLKGAFLGLDFLNKECYALPYNKNTGTKDKPVWVKELQFQTDYKGEIKLAKKYSINPIKDIYAKVVKTGDVFEEEIINGHQSVNFKPIIFNDENIVGAFAVVLFKDGSMNYDTMSIKDIEDTRKNFSKQKDGQAWTKSYGEMCKKTVLRRLCKLIEIDFDNQEQHKAFEDGSAFEVNKKKLEHTPVSSLDVVDVESKEVENAETN